MFVVHCGLALAIALAGSSYMETQKLSGPWTWTALVLSAILTLSPYADVLRNLLAVPPSVLLVLAVGGAAAGLAHFRALSAVLTAAVAASAASLTGLFVWLSMWQVHPELCKFGLAAVVFGVTAWRRRRSEEHFVRDMGKSVGMSMLLWPVVVMGVACCFVLLAAVTDALGVSHAAVNPVIFYGIFYFPLVTTLVLFQHYQSKRRVEDSIV